MHNHPALIWLLVDSSSIGGIETHILQLASGLQNHSQNVHVVFLRYYPNHPLYAQLDEQKITYTFIKRSPFSLIKSILKNRPTIIHTHGYKAGIMGRSSALISHTACISTFHAGERSSGKVGLYDYLDRISAGLGKYSVAVSQQVSERLFTQNQIMNNFVDTTKTVPSQGKNIAFVGRLSKEKGPDIFLDIARNMSEHSFHLYGDGPMASNLKKESPNNATFHGFQANMNTVWSNVSVLIISSRYEGLPMAALEAMARGIPVISFDVGALNTLIDHKKNGWLAQSSNHLTLCRYLSQWLEADEQKKQAMRTCAIDKVQRYFSQPAIIPKYLQIYQDVNNNSRTIPSNRIRVSSHD